MARAISPEASPRTHDEREWILFDGECDFCRRIVNRVGRKDRKDVFKIIPYKEARHPALTPDVRNDCERSVHVIRRDGTVLRAGVACLYVAYKLGWRWANPLAKPPFIWPIEAAYRVVADNRQVFSKFLFTKEVQ